MKKLGRRVNAGFSPLPQVWINGIRVGGYAAPVEVLNRQSEAGK